jgi:hypothetical protein
VSSWASARSYLSDQGRPSTTSIQYAAKRTLHQHIREARLATLQGALPVRPPEVCYAAVSITPIPRPLDFLSRVNSRSPHRTASQRILCCHTPERLVSFSAFNHVRFTALPSNLPQILRLDPPLFIKVTSGTPPSPRCSVRC